MGQFLFRPTRILVESSCTECVICRVVYDAFSCDGVDSLTVSVQLGDDQQLSRDIGVYCGSRMPPMIMSAGSQLHGGGYLQLSFMSIASTSHRSRGFAAAFQFISGQSSTSTSSIGTFSNIFFGI